MYQSSHVYTESAEYTKPRKRRYLARPPSHVPIGSGHSPSLVGRAADYVSTWTSMRLAPVRCRVLLHSLLPTDDACSSSIVCQRPSSNFPYFRIPLANFLLSRPNSVEYGNCKTTIHCCPRLNVCVHSSKVELAAAGVYPVGMISSHASI